MEQKKTYREIDDYEEGILSYVNIKKDQYRISNLKYINSHYLEFNWKKKKGPTVLLLHGYGASSITYFKIIPGFIYAF
jgi:pimeloyl-ACP methyl ester carboxylesterase